MVGQFEDLEWEYQPKSKAINDHYLLNDKAILL